MAFAVYDGKKEREEEDARRKEGEENRGVFLFFKDVSASADSGLAKIEDENGLW